MGDEFPTEYDVIIVGTGMTESILAAAASRVGKRVLHLDSNEFYGGLWASFNLEGLQQWLEECQQPRPPAGDSAATETTARLEGGERLLMARQGGTAVTHVQQRWHVAEELGEAAEGEEKPWDQAAIKKAYRKFNIDLAPKLLFSRGGLVELLISSNIARYTEFRNASRVLTWADGHLTPVPCSRADVFATQNISVVEKRMLMSLLTECTQYENNPDKLKEHAGEQTFLDYLKGKQLTENLTHYVLHAIAMATEQTSCIEGMQRTQKFLQSLGRYGNTPFLWPMYGSGELPQAFCRLCAVFGGLYHLKRGTEGLVLSEDGKRVQAVVSGGERLKTNFLIMAEEHAPSEVAPEPPQSPTGISRAVFILDKSILPSEREHLTLLQFPPLPGVTEEPVTIIEVGGLTHACPPGLYVLHLTARQRLTAEEDLGAVAALLMRQEDAPDGEKPRVLWSLYFNTPDTSVPLASGQQPGRPENLFLTSGPDTDLDFDCAIEQARSIFSGMYSDCEFLPRAPDPEEIVHDSEEDPQEEAAPQEEGQ